MSRLHSILILGLVVVTSGLTGCRSADPYCQTAIANLRAEKIQLENEYYALKSRYESDMARAGQTPTYNPAYDPHNSSYSTPVSPGIRDGEIIYDGGYYSGSTIQSGNGNATVPTMVGSPGNNAQPEVSSGNRTLAGHIRNIEVNQLPAVGNETTRLLVRPLDNQGAILPITGDVKVRLYDPTSGHTVFENQFAASQVQSWISDQPGQQPGIHLPIPNVGSPSLSERLVCDLQYRTADNRILKQSTELLFGSASMSAAGAQPNFGRQPATQPTQNTSQPFFQPESIEGELEIEIGEELNFDSLGSDDSAQRPKWSPDR